MDQALKQRLVGATILIALAVIFLPLLLDGEQRNGQATTPIEIPERPDVDFKTRRLPVGDHARPQEQRKVPEAPVTESPAASKPAVSTPPEPVVQVIEEEPMVAGRGDWLVQVGSFSSLDNANTVSSNLEKLGYAAMLEATGINADSLIRVKIGPFSSQEEAKLAAGRVRSAIPGINPRVMTVDGQIGLSAVDTDGWIVQLGIFTVSENAAKQATRLQTLGFTVNTVTSNNGGTPVFTLKTGVVADRTAAEQLRDRIKAESDIAGMVKNLAAQ